MKQLTLFRLQETPNEDTVTLVKKSFIEDISATVHIYEQSDLVVIETDSKQKLRPEDIPFSVGRYVENINKFYTFFSRMDSINQFYVYSHSGRNFDAVEENRLESIFRSQTKPVDSVTFVADGFECQYRDGEFYIPDELQADKLLRVFSDCMST